MPLTDQQLTELKRRYKERQLTALRAKYSDEMIWTLWKRWDKPLLKPGSFDRDPETGKVNLIPEYRDNPRTAEQPLKEEGRGWITDPNIDFAGIAHYDQISTCEQLLMTRLLNLKEKIEEEHDIRPTNNPRELRGIWQDNGPSIIRRLMGELKDYGMDFFAKEIVIDFRGANLEEVSFHGAIFKLNDKFDGTICEFTNFRGADLSNASFVGSDCYESDFSGATLRKTDFKGANLLSANLEQSDCREAVFDNADLTGAIFKYCPLKQASFIGVDCTETIFDEAKLERTSFNLSKGSETSFNSIKTKGGLVEFKGVTFTEVSFRNSSLSGVFFDEYSTIKQSWFNEAKVHNCKFNDSDLSVTNFDGADCRLSKFNRAICEYMNFDETDIRDVSFINSRVIGATFLNARVNSDTKFDIKLIEEKEKRKGHWESITETYVQIKNAFKNSGYYDEAGHYYFREMHCRRMAGPQKGGKLYQAYWKTKEWLKEYTIGYGERPFWMFGWIGATILIFSGIFSATGIQCATNGEFIRSWPKALYLSVVTFATLGYGDYAPYGFWGKFFAGIEALLGLLFVGLFVVSMARKIIRD